MRPKRWGGPTGPRGYLWTRSAFKESRGGPAPTLRHAACALLVIALGAGFAGAAAAPTATTVTKSSTAKSTAAHTAAKATGAKPTTSSGPAAHKVAAATGTTAARTAQPKAAAHPAIRQTAKSATSRKGNWPEEYQEAWNCTRKESEFSKIGAAPARPGSANARSVQGNPAGARRSRLL